MRLDRSPSVLGRERRRAANGISFMAGAFLVLGLDLALFFGIHA
jgi:hypothetical protein